jgi:hypothetical protein
VFALVRKHPHELQQVAVGEYVQQKVFAQYAEVANQEVAGVSPPTLIAPANMAHLVIARQESIEFSWTEFPQASQYRVRIFRDLDLHAPAYDRKVATTSIRINGLAEGLYYWVVQSIDAKGKESGESEQNRFFLQVDAPELSIDLKVLELVQHGHVIQVRGKTHPSAKVMVNGQFVPFVSPDGLFDYFTPPLGDGRNTISITAQNSQGGVRTIRRTVTIN